MIDNIRSIFSGTHLFGILRKTKLLPVILRYSNYIIGV
jgi:hypothetical protein